MIRRIAFVLASLFAVTFLYGQELHIPVFADLDGDDLKDAVIRDYKTNTVLSYRNARDTFMLKIDRRDGVIECIYTGLTVDIPVGVDPSTAAFNQGVNTEHVYPRSKGAVESSKGHNDMHHLFPCRQDVNSARGSLAFGEILDTETDRWYRLAETKNSVPTSNKDDYSEFLSGQRFEPREDKKGDIARAIFYFYTMYESNALAEDPDFFESQRETMCDWHFYDPVDEVEWQRTYGIAAYQDDKPNPFVLDCSLARMYCDDISTDCQTVSTDDAEAIDIALFPNPFYDVLDVQSPDQGEVVIYSLEGREVFRKMCDHKAARLDLSALSAGTYVLKYSINNVPHVFKIKKI